MATYKKITVASFLLASTIVGIGTTHSYGDDDDLTKDNLRVIPKSISKENLELFMTRYSREIGVSCEYCHVVKLPLVGHGSVNFASDAKPEKNIAREMMKMTNRINKKYFGVRNTYEQMLKLPVTCATCHRGISHPNKLKLF